MAGMLFSLLVSLAFAQPTQLPFADSLAKASRDPLRIADAYSEAWNYDLELKALEACNPPDPKALWRMARAHVDIGENLRGDASEAEFEKAQGLVERSIAIDSTDAEGQQMLAITLGRVAMFRGIFKSIPLAKRIYAAAHRAVALGDSVPRALFILGKLHEEIGAKPGFVRSAIGCKWATQDSVAYYYGRVLQTNAKAIQTRVAWAEFILNEKDDKTQARKLLEEAASLPVKDEHDQEGKDKAAELLKGLK